MVDLPESDYEVRKLSEKFYSDYPNSDYPEILTKAERAYNCLLFQTCYDYFICVPFRSEVKHKYAFHFKRSRRSQNSKSGLDYRKIVIINNLDYIDSELGIIDNDEYVETRRNIEKIKRRAFEFVRDYVDYLNGVKTMDREEFDRRYKWSSLQYFHSELGIG